MIWLSGIVGTIRAALEVWGLIERKKIDDGLRQDGARQVELERREATDVASAKAKKIDEAPKPITLDDSLKRL